MLLMDTRTKKYFDLYYFIKDNQIENIHFFMDHFERFIDRFGVLSIGYFRYNSKSEGQVRHYTLEDLKSKTKEQLSFILSNMFLMYLQCRGYSEGYLVTAFGCAEAFVYSKLLPSDFDLKELDQDDLTLFTICTHFLEYVKHFLRIEGTLTKKEANPNLYKLGDIVPVGGMGKYNNGMLSCVTTKKDFITSEEDLNAFLDFHWEQFNRIYMDKPIYFSEDVLDVLEDFGNYYHKISYGNGKVIIKTRDDK